LPAFIEVKGPGFAGAFLLGKIGCPYDVIPEREANPE
jgi:hypothetical protein